MTIDKHRDATSIATKFFAVLLVLGGATGTLLGLYTLQQSPLAFVFVLLFVVVFAGCVWAGIQLYKETADGYRWGKILYAAQIPVLSLAPLIYDFSAGLKIWLLIGLNGTFGVHFYLGPKISLIFSPDVEVSHFGVNILALAAFMHLSKHGGPTDVSDQLTSESTSN